MIVSEPVSPEFIRGIIMVRSVSGFAVTGTGASFKLLFVAGVSRNAPLHVCVDR